MTLLVSKYYAIKAICLSSLDNEQYISSEGGRERSGLTSGPAVQLSWVHRHTPRLNLLGQL